MTSNYKEETKRHSFEKVSSIQEIPHLLDIQKGSFEEFLQKNVAPEERNNIGLQASFNNIFPIEGAHGNYMLEFKYYTVGEPRYNVQECIDRGVSYTVPLKVRLVLHVREEDTEKGEYSTGIEQDVFFGNIPNMTKKGTFVFNGAERIIVSQIQRSPGVFFDEGKHSSGNTIYTARIIPKRGSWVDFIVDHRDIIYTVIDRRHKFPATILLRAFGYETNEEILTLLNAGERIDISTKKARKEAQGRVLADSLVDPETGEVVYDLKDLQEVDDEILEICKEHDIQSLLVFTTEDDIERQVFVSTFRKDSATFDKESALYFLYKNLRTGEPPNMETAEKYIKRMFFSPKKYDLGRVGRYRMNEKFDLDVPVEDKVLTKDDFIEIVIHIIDMKKGNLGPDDIDHLGNRRVRTISEQMENQFNIALNRMSRTIKERMNLRESENLTPQNLINSRIITSVLNTFFGTGQLSQYLEQTNPLAETTHKRRTSALGPGGLTRERAGFEVRDVHYTHYGRICPIETPEGPNIGLITSLASYAHVNDLGFLETPYRKVEKQNGKTRVTEEVHFLSADDEDREMIAQANSETNEDGYFVNDTVRCRIKGEVPVVDQSEVTYMDVSPQQLVSASSALIPFLEHDDANRALMGSNMQRQ
ncbi:MAG TPA: DNA-directed RNA polymerase subunit beta, partial [bacterium]|nr:DNA-directed RNA polymerase subunit beta [bacterium]